MAPILAFIPLIAAGVGAATAGIEMANKPGAPNPAIAAEAAAAASQAQAEALTKRRGMAATQLTSPMGTTGTAETSKTTLG